jgi:hypothetical protein
MGEEHKTAAEWAKQKGTPPEQYGPAEVLHGWGIDTDKQLTEAAYDAALEAAAKPNEDGDYVPHAAAVGDFDTPASAADPTDTAEETDEPNEPKD